MQRIKWLLILMLPFLASCASGTGTDTFCVLAKPIYLRQGDSLTPDTAREILSHDEVGRTYCDWQRT
jgi:hypothetical protein